MRLSINFPFALSHFPYWNVSLTYQRERALQILSFLNFCTCRMFCKNNMKILTIIRKNTRMSHCHKHNWPPSLTFSYTRKINCCNLCTFNLAGTHLSVSATTLVQTGNCHSSQSKNGWTTEIVWIFKIYQTLYKIWFKLTQHFATCHKRHK